jgi:membrane fusion protein, multidrug efflux system
MKHHHWIYYTIIALAPSIILFSACGKKDSTKGDAKDKNNQIVNVKTAPVELSDFTEVVQITGTVASFEDVKVPAEEGGRVMKWLLEKGAHVAKGQIIAQLDDALLKAGYDAANAAYKIAQTNFEKQQKVFAEQGISELQIKTFEYQRDAAKAQSDLMKSRWEKMQVKSPIEGILNNRFVNTGEMIGPGMPIAHVVNVNRLKISAGVPERYANSFKVGDEVRFTVDAIPGETFTGKVGFAAAAINRDNRTLPAEIFVTATRQKLKPDMIASLKIVLSSRPNSIVISEDYMQKADLNRFVVFVDNNGIAEERTIKIGSVNGGKVLVESGLKEGERLITLGFQNVANGQKINVQN